MYIEGEREKDRAGVKMAHTNKTKEGAYKWNVNTYTNTHTYIRKLSMLEKKKEQKNLRN